MIEQSLVQGRASHFNTDLAQDALRFIYDFFN